MFNGSIPIFHGSIPIFHGSIPIDPSQTHHIAPPWLHAMQAPRDIFRCHDRGRDWSDLRCSVNQLSFPTKWGCPVVVDTNRSGLKLRIWGLYIGCEWLKHVKTSQVEIVFVPKKWEVWEVQSDLWHPRNGHHLCSRLSGASRSGEVEAETYGPPSGHDFGIFLPIVYGLSEFTRFNRLNGQEDVI